MSASLAGLSASVTRILFLTGFPKELKTKDIQSAFSEWEAANGGFKIKWRDDTSLLIVFQDASVAKRAYLHTLAYPPPSLTSSNGVPASIRPYDGADAQNVIQTVNARGQHNSNPSRSHNSRSASISVFPGGGLNNNNNMGGRSVSGPIPNGITGPSGGYRHNGTASIAIPEYPSGMSAREGSPTLPSLPSHPTLNSLISSSLGEAVANPTGHPSGAPADPAILATSLQSQDSIAGGPRIGDPGKRMLGAALGVRHPGLGARGNGAAGGNADQAMSAVQRAMGGLVVAE